MKTVAILPVKRFRVAKQRLDEDLQDGTKRALTEAMVTDVLVALRRSKRVGLVLVVTGDPTAEAIARGYDADVVADPDDAGHVAAANLGIAEARARGAERAVLVPGDCPALDPKELDRLLAGAGHGPEVLIVPDRHGSGTNALVLTPPEALEPAFGPGSRERHERLAIAAGVKAAVVDVPSLGLDVDTVDDLEALRSALDRYTGGAAHTRGLLARVSRLVP